MDQIKVKVKRLKAGSIAYIEHRGAYDAIPWERYLGRLYAWTKESKAKPGFKPFGIYYDDPSRVPPGECRCDVAIPIRGSPGGSGEIKVRAMPEMEVATTKFVGTGDQIGPTYAALHAWIGQNGYELAGAPMEVCTQKPKAKDGKTVIYSDIQFPVKKRQIASHL